MKHSVLKKTAALFAALTVLTLTGCAGGAVQSSTPQPEAPAVTGNVTVTVFDVGKADAMVIQTENSVTVIDAANKGDGKCIDKFLTKQGIDTVDLMIITHFDKDHVGGASRVINKMNVKEVLVPNYESELEEYKNFVEKVEETETPVTKLDFGASYDWTPDDIACTVYASERDNYGRDEENDFSLVMYMQHGENKFLFAGDAEDPRQQEIMALGLGKVDFMKFPYHGNYLSTTEQFLDTFDPKYTVVCCSEKEYADPNTVETLEKRKIETYYTCDGNVTVVSDGKALTCTQEAPAK